MDTPEIQILLLALFLAIVITITDMLLVRAYNKDLKDIKEMLKK